MVAAEVMEKYLVVVTVGGGNEHFELKVFKPMPISLRHFNLISSDFEGWLSYCISLGENFSENTQSNWATQALEEQRDITVRGKINSS